LVASFDQAGQDEWLERARREQWTAKRLRRELEKQRPAEKKKPRRGVLPARANQGPSRLEILEHVDNEARAVLRAARPFSGSHAQVPAAVLDRLANATDFGPWRQQ
jgi:hypothetical protein